MNSTTTAAPTAQTKLRRPTRKPNGKPKGPAAAKAQAALNRAIREYRKAMDDHASARQAATKVSEICERLEAANRVIVSSLQQRGVASISRGDQVFGDGRLIHDFPATSSRPACQVAVSRGNGHNRGTMKAAWFVACKSVDDWNAIVQYEPFFKTFEVFEFGLGVIATAELLSLTTLIGLLDDNTPSCFDKCWRFLTDSEFARVFPQR